MLLKTHGVTIQNLRFLRGPNLYAYKKVMKILIDIGPYENHPSDHFPGFVKRMTTWLPDLHKHECGLQKPGGFVERLETGTYLGHIVEHITLELQGLMGFHVTFGRARSTKEPGVYTVVIAYEEEKPAEAAFETALRMTLAAMHNEPFDVEAELEKLRSIADEYRLGPSTDAIVQAARRRKIPIIRLIERGSLVQLGWGIHQKRIQASETSMTSQIAVELCQEKSMTNRMLSAVGVPVPEGQVVDSADHAWIRAKALGLPVVIKPEAGNQGKGVCINLNSESEVRAAYEIAKNYGERVLVEQFIQGQDYRLLVVNGKMVAAAMREPAQVVGDGKHTVVELVEEVNKDPRRREGHSSILTKIRMDEEANLVLAQQKLTKESIPKEGQVVLLRNNSNLSTGGTATDVTAEVHPNNVRLAELAAQILAMDVAGLDVVCQDIRRPLSEQQGAIVEVNAAPGLRMHLYPTKGQPQDVGSPIVEMLYPQGALSRIPILAVTGTNGKTTVTRLLGHMYETGRYIVGMTCTEGTYINRDKIMGGDCSGPKSASAVLLHPRVEVAVLETARGGILREGLAFDRCKVGIVTNISADHLGLGGVETVEELAKVKQVVVECAEKDGAAVLNADDPLVAEMAAATEARVIYFSLDPKNYILSAHLAQGGAGVFVEDNRIMLATGSQKTELIELERVPFTGGGKIPFQIQNALAATAGAWGAGLNPAMMIRALTTFTTSEDMVPGRFNLLDRNGVEIVVDYGHNAAALKALGQALFTLTPKKTLMILNLPGDRRDQELVQTLQATLPFVQSYIFHDAYDLRGRAPQEVPKLLQSTLPPKTPSCIVKDQKAAIAKAWTQLRPGDRLVIIVDNVEETIGMLKTLPETSVSTAHDDSCMAPLSMEAEEAKLTV